MRTLGVGFLALALSMTALQGAAHAQTPPPPTPPPPPPPPVVQTPPPAPNPAPVVIPVPSVLPQTPPPAGLAPNAPPEEKKADPALLRAFRASYLSYDALTHEVRQGSNGPPLEREQLYQILRRPDLLEETDRRETKRTLLFLGAGGLLATGVVTGVVLLATAPNMNSPECLATADSYNNGCSPDNTRHQIFGAMAIGAGVLGGSALAFVAFGVNLDPLTPDEKQRAIASYNGALMAHLRNNAATRPWPTSIRFTPVFDLHGGGLAAAARF